MDNQEEYPHNWPLFITKLLVLSFVLSIAIYVHQTPKNPFEFTETYNHRPEQSMEGVLELTESNWSEYVSYRTQPILLFLYAPSVRCAWSSDFADTFASLALQIKNDQFPEIRNITVAKLDGFENRFLAFELGIRGFPSIMLLETPPQQSEVKQNRTRKSTELNTASSATTETISADSTSSTTNTHSNSNNEKSDIDNENTEDSFDGSFIRKTILEEIDGFGGINMNKVNRNEYTEYKGKRNASNIMIWLYKQILSQKVTRTRISNFEKWHSAVESNYKKSVLVLIYNSGDISEEQMNIFHSIKFIDTGKLDLNNLSDEEKHKILDPYRIDTNEPKAVLFLAARSENTLKIPIELKLETGIDFVVLEHLKQQQILNRDYHDEL
jgi:hypothetical protein